MREELTAAVKPVAVRADKKNLDLTWHVSPKIPGWIRGDSTRLRQILVNLVGNAIKFTEVGFVAVDVLVDSVKEDSIVLHFLVKDTGVGIAKEMHSKVFSAFEQADSSTTREFGGTGLGLAITKKIVEAMEGTIWLESKVGVGSTFHFTAVFERSVEDELGAEDVVDLSDLRCVIADGDRHAAQELKEALKCWKMEVHVVHSTQSAVDTLQELSKNEGLLPILITDVNLEGIGGSSRLGHELVDGLLEEIPVIRLTSGERDESLIRSRALQTNTCLIKPPSLPKLRSAVMRSRRLLQAHRPKIADQELKGRPLRILLAEDGLANQEVALGLLKHLGHVAVVASNGGDAVRLFMSKKFDLILMDVQMPILNGIRATRKIRDMEAGGSSLRGSGTHIPIIAMTANAMKGDRERCIHAGMDDYLAKPVRKHELQRMLLQYTSGHDRWDAGKRQSESLAVDPEPEKGGGPAENESDDGEDSVPVIDWREALENSANDHALLEAVKLSALDELPRVLSWLTDSFESGEKKEVKRHAHTLKGTARAVAGCRTVILVEELERAEQEGDAAGAKLSLVKLCAGVGELIQTLKTADHVSQQDTIDKSSGKS